MQRVRLHRAAVRLAMPELSILGFGQASGYPGPAEPGQLDGLSGEIAAKPDLSTPSTPLSLTSDRIGVERLAYLNRRSRMRSLFFLALSTLILSQTWAGPVDINKADAETLPGNSMA